MDYALSLHQRARVRRSIVRRSAVGGLAFAVMAMAGSAASVHAQAPASPTPAQPDCSPKNGLSFVCGLVGVEDIVAAPGRRWLIGSSHKRNSAGLYVIDTRTRTAKPAALSIAPGAGGAPFAGCPAPDLKALDTHGLDLRPGKGGVHTIYAVNHQNREAIEVFSLDVRGAEPVIQWTGCLIVPPSVSANGVVALPGGGIAVTKFQNINDRPGYDRMLAGEVSGSVYIWRPGKGFSEAPGSQFAGDNGIVVSPDGKLLFIAEYGLRAVHRIAIDGSAPPATVSMAYRPDNLRWDDNGKILVGGQFMDDGKPLATHAWSVDSLDPKTMVLTHVTQGGPLAEFSNATTAIRGGGMLWLGTYAGDRIAYIPAP